MSGYSQAYVLTGVNQQVNESDYLCFIKWKSRGNTTSRIYLFKKRVQTTRQRCYELGMTRNPVVSVSHYVWLYLLFVYTSNWQCFVLAGFIQMRLYTYLLHHAQKHARKMPSLVIVGQGVKTGCRDIRNSPSLNVDINWLVVYLPLWKIWVRQLGSSFPIYGKKSKCSKPLTS